MVEAGGGSRFVSAVLGDPNASRFGTRLHTIRLKNDPPDHFFNGGCPLRLQLPLAQKKTDTPCGVSVFLVEAARNHPFSRHFYMDIEAKTGATAGMARMAIEPVYEEWSNQGIGCSILQEP